MQILAHVLHALHERVGVVAALKGQSEPLVARVPVVEGGVGYVVLHVRCHGTVEHFLQTQTARLYSHNSDASTGEAAVRQLQLGQLLSSAGEKQLLHTRHAVLFL